MEHPNVLLITVDHWPASFLGAAGHPAIKTPTLDQFARNGIRFANASSECPVCIPARRSLMTGLMPRTHGSLQNDHKPMPDSPTLAHCFADAGYQTYAVGKLHVTPQRDRIGFDDVLLDEEGRALEGVGQDDYELYLGDHGYPGMRFAGGMNNNDYTWRPWHLPENMHVTNWAAAAMSRQIKRRDPLKPGFWYLSFSHPHPPLTPLQIYLDMYRDVDPPSPFRGEWSMNVDTLPTALRQEIERLDYWNERPDFIKDILRAFYAQCTHIDHQIRRIIGTLREEGLLNDTIICFTADHGDMLGNHGMWAKHQMYEDSLGIPMILVGTEQQMRNGPVDFGTVDPRLVGLSDVMPTLLELAGIPVPDCVEGISMVGQERKNYAQSLWGTGEAEGMAHTRMVRDHRHKLVYYPMGNVEQLFDLEHDPQELTDIADKPESQSILETLRSELIAFLQESEEDSAWVEDGRLTGHPDKPYIRKPNRGLTGQRGDHFPPPKPGNIAWS